MSRVRIASTTLFTSLCFMATALVAWSCSSSDPATAASGVQHDGTDASIEEPVDDDGGRVDPTPGGDASADASQPDSGASGGKGGLTCTAQDDLGGGRKSCVTMVGNVELRFVLPASGSTPLRLGLYLHGDGAAAHKSNSALKAMVPWADAQHGIGVSALAPNGCSWWLAPTHDCTSSSTTDRDATAANATALVSAIEAVMKAYDVRTDGVRYYGSSGGSIFLTDEWIPLQGARFPGVFALMCGGEVTQRAYAWNVNDATLRARNPLWFTYGDRDDLLPDIQTSIADFKTKQFAVTEKVVANAGHCEFNSHGEAIGIWTAVP